MIYLFEYIYEAIWGFNCIKNNTLNILNNLSILSLCIGREY